MILSPLSRSRRIRALLSAALWMASIAGAFAQASFVNWETPPVHPIDLSPDGQTLAVVSPPLNRVDLYEFQNGIPAFAGSVAVGLDPVTVRFRNNDEAWVVNFISDSISVVDVPGRRLKATISGAANSIDLDEPQDVVFAGQPLRAFVSCSQVNRVQVFDVSAFALGATIHLKIEDPRALAVSADGLKVYAAAFESGNATTILGGGADATMSTGGYPPDAVGDPAGPYGGANPPPNSGGVNGVFLPAKNPDNGTPPRVSLIVRKNEANEWRDDNNANWTAMITGALASKSGRPVGWDMPDRDLAIIDTQTLEATYAKRLMNACMSVAVNPANGLVYVVGTDGTNEVRFEPNIKGRFLRVQAAIVDPATATRVGLADLNPHLDYNLHQAPQSTRDRSIGDPRAIVWNAAGTRGYVTGMGSNNMIVIDADGARIAGTESATIELGEGPTGIALDEARGRVYVLNRFASSISVLDSATLGELARVSYDDPTPQAIKTGRKHLYDTRKNSGLGHVACGSCHLDAKMDRLAWDLGDPSGVLDPTAGQNSGGDVPVLLGTPIDPYFHPMKGPMVTQTLQDIIGLEPFHWRGDRDGLEDFNPAFMGLQGDDVELSEAEMQEFEDFLATVFIPPNPYRNIDNTLPAALETGEFKSGRFGDGGAPLPTGNAIAGLAKFRDGFGGAAAEGPNDCVSCHTLPTGAGPNRSIVQITASAVTFPVFEGSPGANGENHLLLSSVDGSTQDALKIPQLRNQFDKIGFEATPGHLESMAGFGVLHDGSVDSIARFVSEPVFRVRNDQDVADLVAFLMAFSGSDLPLGKTSGTITPRDLEPLGEPSNDTHAAVGKQTTMVAFVLDPMLNAILGEGNESGSTQARGIDVIGKMNLNGEARGWFYNRFTGNFVSDRDSEGELTYSQFRNLATPATPLTVTAVPRGSGIRMGIDADEDGFGDRTEIDACSDPMDATSTPLTPDPELATTPAMPGGSIAFGTWNVASGASAPLSATVRNSGAGLLRFKGAKLAIVGTDATDFRISNAPSTAPLAASASVTAQIVFDPTTAGSKSASLLVVTTDCDEPSVLIPIVGTASDEPLPTPTPSLTPTASQTPSVSPTATPTATPSPIPPTFVLHPKSQKVNAQRRVEFYAQATGDPAITLDWEKNGAPGFGASGALVIEAASAADAGTYRCRAENGGGSALSNAATLTVFDPPMENDAEPAGDTAPDAMAPAEEIHIGVAVRNTSPLTWSSAQGYSLAVIEDVDGLFMGASRLGFILADEVVASDGGTYQFVAKIKAPAAEGTHTARLRMVQEGVEFFGDELAIAIETQPKENAAADWERYE